MKKRKSTLRPSYKFPARVRGSLGGDTYVNGLPDRKMETKGIRAMTSEEIDWLNKFNLEYCDNKHNLEDSLHSALSNYESEIKSEMYSKVNAASRDLLTLKQNTYQTSKLTEVPVTDAFYYEDEDSAESLHKHYGVEEATEIVLEQTRVDLLSCRDVKAERNVLFNLFTAGFKMLSLERRLKRIENKKEKND